MPAGYVGTHKLTLHAADVQWNPHLSRAEYIVSTSGEKLYALPDVLWEATTTNLRQ
jgi:hypothetical protein